MPKYSQIETAVFDKISNVFFLLVAMATKILHGIKIFEQL